MFGLVILLVSVFSIYANTFHAAWHMDDTPNIVDNRPLHIDNLMPGTLWQTFFAKPGHPGSYYRPVACLTFALNWFLGRDDPTGYHAVNILFHALTAFLLYLVGLRLFQTPVLKTRKEGKPPVGLSPHRVALLAALLWAVHPLQTQAVTYIVQRMAQLAAFFCLAAMLFYLRGRLSPDPKKRWLNFLGCGICGLLGVMSKENAVILPMSLVLLEVCFFRPRRLMRHPWRLVMAGFGIGLGVYILGITLFLNGDYFFFLKAYPARPYTPLQRLLTETRILWFYLSQLALPLPGRFSIEHDVVVSTSLWSPWTTLPAVVGIGGLVALSLKSIKMRPLAAFGVLFFLLNHMVESSVIGLELLFEHRNYLPTLFLFIALSAGIQGGVARLRVRHKSRATAANVVVILLVCALGMGTFMRNRVWQDGQTLWLDALSKAPNSARALNTLAIRLAWAPDATPEQMDKAIGLFQRSLKGHKARTLMDADIYGNIANVFSKKGDFAAAVPYLEKAAGVDPNSIKIQLDLASALLRTGDWAGASEITSVLVEKYPRHLRVLNTHGFILLWLDAPQTALASLRNALRIAPHDYKVLINIGAALKMLGHFVQADWFFQRAIEQAPFNVWAYLFLVDNQLQAGRYDVAQQYLRSIVAQFSLERVMAAFNVRKEVLPPCSRDLIRSAIMNLNIDDPHRSSDPSSIFIR